MTTHGSAGLAIREGGLEAARPAAAELHDGREA